MQANVSKVNFRKLVKDLADMYSDHPFDVVVTELVANSLDAMSKFIAIDWDDQAKVLVVADDGAGMTETQFAEYHDFAVELKSRGDGIGFAGVGAKISFNIASRVVTETRSNGKANASDWRWAGDGSLSWDAVQASRLKADGTRVEVHFDPQQIPNKVNSDYLLSVLKGHYLPLFIDEFVQTYQTTGVYKTCPAFAVNGMAVEVCSLKETVGLSHSNNFKVPQKNKIVGVGVLGVLDEEPPAEDRAGYGVLLCAHGKVIKPEMFGLPNGTLGARLFGIAEIPALIKYITTNKSDLKRGRNKDLESLLSPVRENLRQFLSSQGVEQVDHKQNQLSAKLESELSKMVKKLPELQDFDGLLAKSQKLRRGENGNIPASETERGDSQNPREAVESGEGGDSGGENRNPLADDKQGNEKAKRQKRKSRNDGPRVTFVDHSARAETAWLEASTIVINSGHHAYRQRISNDQARMTYCMFSIGVALDKELGDASDGISYVDKVIAAWGAP